MNDDTTVEALLWIIGSCRWTVHWNVLENLQYNGNSQSM